MGEMGIRRDDEAYLIASNKMESPADARKSEAMYLYIEVRVGGVSVRFVKNPAVCLYRQSGWVSMFGVKELKHSEGLC